VAQEALLTSQFLVALAMFAVAGYLLKINFGGTLHRSFALLMFLRGLIILSNQMSRLPSDAADIWFKFAGYLLIALPLAIIDFWIVFQWRASTKRRRAARVANLGVLVLVEVLYLSNHALLFEGSPMEFTSGPLAPFSTAYVALFALLALWFALGARAARTTVARRVQYLISLGFATGATVDSIVLWRFALVEGWPALWAPAATPSAAEFLTDGFILAGLPLSLIAAALLVMNPIGRNRTVTQRWVFGLFGVCLVLPVLARSLDPTSTGRLFLLVLGLARLLMPAIIGFAIVRYAESGVDPLRFESKLNVALRRGTLGTLFVAAYFAFGDVLGNTLPQTPLLQRLDPLWAQVIGAAGAGALLLALHPLRRASERLTNTVVANPGTPRALTAAQRADLYADQAVIAWSDGSISRKERLLLDQLRQRLQLAPEIASQLESKAAKVAVT
jgi:hypothetical protein